MAWPRRTLRPTLILAAVGLLLLGIALYLRKQAPPECARLLPESQAILYFNLRPLRAATHFDRRPVPHDPEYQRFIDATGIDFERDLDEAAFALHRTADPLGPNGPVAYSEVFSGSFDAPRLARYLAAASSSQESYAGRTVYSVANAGRTVRVALLGTHMVAVSNTPTAEQMHSILDRYRAWVLPFSGSSLLAAYYKDVPLLSLAWGLGEIALPFTDHGAISVMGLTLPMRLDTTFIASLRWTGSLRLRIEQIAPSEAAATAAAKTIETLVNLGRMAENNLPGSLANENARALLNSATVVHYNDRAVLNATLPAHFFETLMSTPDAVVPSSGSGSR
jgi:hypothetical protein